MTKTNNSFIGFVGGLEIPESMENKNGFENILNEIIAENFHNLQKDMGIQIQEAHRHDQKFSSTTHVVSFKHKTER